MTLSHGYDASKSQITDSGLPELRTLVNLTTLELPGVKITAVGLRELQKLPKLKILNLYESQITDDALEELATMDLAELNLSQTRITNDAIAHLSKWRSLRCLNVAA